MSKSVKILLIEPPYYRLIGEKRCWVPTNLISIATILDLSGFEAKVYNADADFIEDEEYILSYSDKYYKTEFLLDENNTLYKKIFLEIESVIKFEHPNIIGISVKSESVPIVLEIINLIKRISSKIKIILGGPHFSVDNELKYFKEVDMIFRGEAEENIVEVMEKINSENFYRKPLLLENNRKINIEKLPLLNLNVITEFQKNNIKLMKKFMIYTSRGCPFKCFFCCQGLQDDNVRFLSGKKVVQNFLNVYNFCKINRFYLIDDTFGINHKQIINIKSFLEKYNINFTWSCMSHVNVLNKEKISLFKKMGCIAIHLGIESGSERILKYLGKNVNIEDIKRVSNYIKENEIDLRIFMLVGIPGENAKDIEQSIKLIKELIPNEVATQVLQLYPNTFLYRTLKAKGYNLEINWAEFRRKNMIIDIYKDSSIRDIKNRIKRFLYFTDEWNLQQKKME